MKLFKMSVLIVAVLATMASVTFALEKTNDKLVAALKEYAESAPNAAERFQRLFGVINYVVGNDEKMKYLDESLAAEAKTPAEKLQVTMYRSYVFIWMGRPNDATAIYETNLDNGDYSNIRHIVQYESDPAVALKYKKAYLLNQLGVRAPALNSNELLFVLKSIRPDECDDYKAFLDDILRFYRVFQVDSPNLIPFITQVEVTRKQLGDSAPVTTATIK